MKLLSKFSFLAILFAVLFSTSFAFAQPGLQRAIEAKKAHNKNFFAIDGVVATGISLDANGNAVIKVYTKDAKTKGIPAFANGVAVHKSVSGIISAWDQPVAQMRKPPKGGGGTNPQTRLSRPVPIGASLGTYRPNASNFCFAGTLGCRLKRFDLNTGSVTHYILSNNHVIAEQNDGSVGIDQIIQPGTLDNGCTLDLNDIIGTLSAFEPIKFNGQANFVDAAIALTSTSDTDYASPSDAYGAPTSMTQTAYVGMPVQKFGRTTSLTKGEVDSINATVNVAYDAGTATFQDQVIIVGKVRRGKRYVNGTFSDGGDSGSLIVTQANNDPMGLLFAGNTSVTIANPIDTVLSTFSGPNALFMIDDGN